MYNKNSIKIRQKALSICTKICDILEEFIFPNSTIDIG